MSRYKGRPSFTSLTRDFPHTVQKHHGPARAGSEARRRPMNYEKEITKLNANVVAVSKRSVENIWIKVKNLDAPSADLISFLSEVHAAGVDLFLH
jgi:hypothetical protein